MSSRQALGLDFFGGARLGFVIDLGVISIAVEVDLMLSDDMFK